MMFGLSGSAVFVVMCPGYFEVTQCCFI